MNTEASPRVAAPVRRVPDWVITLLDAAAIVTLLLLVSNVAFDGFRVRFGALRVTAESPWRNAVLAGLLLALRHGLLRRPSLPARVAGWARRLWTSPARPAVLPSFLASRAMVLGAGFLGVVLVGYPEGAPPFRISRNEAVNLPVRWDGGWYLQIALDGYDYRSSARPHEQQNIAFFPAYPMLTRLGAAWLGMRTARVGDPVGNRVEWQYAQHRRIVLAGMCVALAAFAWALVYLYRLARDLLDEDAAIGAVVLTCAWPYALFFSAMYTESVFLLGCVGAWHHFRRGEWGAAGGWGLLAGLARPNGFLLSLPLALLLVPQWRAIARNDAGARRRAAAGLAAAAMPGIGMLIFSAFLYQYTGRPLVWMEAHAAWGRVATDVQALVSSRLAFIAQEGIYHYSTSEPVEILNAVPVAAALALAIPIARRLGPAYAVLIVIMIVPPLLRGGFLSLGRLTSTLFPLFLYLGWLCRGSARSMLVLAFAGLQAVLALLFFTWRPFF